MAATQTPLKALRQAPGLGKLHVIAVPGGTHADTYELTRGRIVDAAVSMLRRQRT